MTVELAQVETTAVPTLGCRAPPGADLPSFSWVPLCLFLLLVCGLSASRAIVSCVFDRGSGASSSVGSLRFVLRVIREL